MKIKKEKLNIFLNYLKTTFFKYLKWGVNIFLGVKIFILQIFFLCESNFLSDLFFCPLDKFLSGLYLSPLTLNKPLIIAFILALFIDSLLLISTYFFLKKFWEFNGFILGKLSEAK